jgi:PAS domain S-box-containing protein
VKSRQAIESEISRLQAELERTKKSSDSNDQLVIANAEFSDLITQTTKKVKAVHQQLQFSPESAEIVMAGERMVLMRAKSLSYDFIQALRKSYEADQATADLLGFSILYDIGFVLGKQDARSYQEHAKPKDYLEHLVAGPINFALSGWAKVEFLDDCILTKDDNFFLKYLHYNTFEVDGWSKENTETDNPICAWNAGYSCGWCEEIIGIPLSAVEITCEARSDEHCTFIMAPSSKIEAYVQHEKEKLQLKHDHFHPQHFQIKSFQDKLLHDDKLLNDALHSAKIGIWKYNLIDDTLYWSKQLYDIFEAPKNKPLAELNDFYFSCLEELDQVMIRDKFNTLISIGESYNVKHKIKTSSGQIKWIDCTGHPVTNQKGQIIGISGIVKEITSDLRELRDLDIFFNLSVDLQCIANDQGYFEKVSPSWCKLLGYSTEQLTTQPFTNFVHPDDLENTYKEMDQLNHGKLSVNFINRYITKDGKEVYISWNSTKDPINQLYYCTARDVTNEHIQREQLLTNLSEKDVLLREIHHRVKNNLQIISSLLSLQSGKNKRSRELNKLYLDSQNRIKSMAAIHELFYQSENLNRIDFSDYIKKLCVDLIHSFMGEKNKIQLNISVHEIYLNLDTAIPLGLIINEIVSNSLKHAFLNSGHGTIAIALENSSAEEYCMTISDDGKGMEIPENIDEMDSLGLTIITSLIEQLDGTYNIDSTHHGTRYTIIFQSQRD